MEATGTQKSGVHLRNPVVALAVLLWPLVARLMLTTAASSDDLLLRGDVRSELFTPKSQVNARVPLWPPDIAELVTEHGYPLEKHWVATDDGYMLQIFRIPTYSSSCTPQPVLLQHGLLDSAAAWILNLPQQSLAFMLHAAGYDVWLGNVRGSTWGLQHSKLDPASEAFWEFTYDDMASQDLPAMIRHVLAASGADSLSYVGHSQGTMIALEALANASSPGSEQNPVAKIDVAVLLAPVAFPRHTTSTLLRTLAQLDAPRIVARFGYTSFLPANIASVFAFSLICRELPSFCVNFLEQVCGPSTALNGTRLPLYLKYLPAGTSVMNMEHWGQAVRENGRLALRSMDFGSDCEGGPWPGACNRRRYASGAPPEIHLQGIRTPIALLSGDHDVLAPPTDVELLREILPDASVVFRKEYKGYSHLDFTLGTSAHVDVYPDVLRVLSEHSRCPASCGCDG